MTSSDSSHSNLFHTYADPLHPNRPQVTILTDRAHEAERELNTEQQRAQKAVRERDKMSQQLQAAQAVMHELRGYRQQYKSIASVYTKVKQELHDVKQKVLSYDLARSTPV